MKRKITGYIQFVKCRLECSGEQRVLLRDTEKEYLSQLWQELVGGEGSEDLVLIRSVWQVKEEHRNGTGEG